MSSVAQAGVIRLALPEASPLAGPHRPLLS